MAEQLHELAEDALDHLVHQFARPMDFIRELVQNSIDAGTPRIEVWVDWNPPKEDGAPGVLEMHVDDFGEGMDEAVIDSQLTRMFSSTKEDDLTKIGKFGIGFTSIFAIQPSAVLIQTGRHGESWELLFHPDRSFDKVRLDTPVRGTQITVYKSLDPADVDGTIGELRWVLEFWCEHSDVPILFSDRRTPTAEAPDSGTTDAADPWGGFAAEAKPAFAAQAIARPMDLDTQVKVRIERDGIEAVVGYMDVPSYGFFNGGITLVRSTDPESLGSESTTLAHLSFKVKSRQLEHTLTRDNVLHDEAWARTIAVVKEAALLLRPLLIDQLEAAAVEGCADLSRWQRFLAAEVRALADYPVKELADRKLVVDGQANPVTVDAVFEQASDWNAFLQAPDSQELTDRLTSQGIHLLDNKSGTEELLAALANTSLVGTIQRFWRDGPPRIVPADKMVVVPAAVDRAQVSDLEWRLLKETEWFIYQGTSLRCQAHLVSLGQALGDAAVPFVTIGDPQAAICRVEHQVGVLTKLRLKNLKILINRDHPKWHVFLTVAAQFPLAARMALSQFIAQRFDLPEGVELAAIDLNPAEVSG